MDKITLDNIEDIAIGAAVLGTGGGGNPQIGLLMAKKILQEYGVVKLIKADQLTKDDVVATVASFGAPSVTIERIPNTDEYDVALKKLEEIHNKKITALYPIEAGGSNSLIPIISAARLGLPLVDADCMGRAFPQLEMITLTVKDIKAQPLVITNPRLDIQVIDGPSLSELEVTARNKAVELGASATISMGLLDGETFKNAAIKNIVTLSKKIGNIIKNDQNPFDRLKSECGALVLFSGKIVNITRKVEGGFNKGFVNIEGIEEDEGSKFLIEIQNENLVAFKNEKIICMVPDLLTLLDEKTAKPITTDSLKFGQRVKAVAFKADEIWRSEKGLEIGGPSAFGYDFKYEKIEDLVGEENV